MHSEYLMLLRLNSLRQGLPISLSFWRILWTGTLSSLLVAIEIPVGQHSTPIFHALFPWPLSHSATSWQLWVITHGPGHWLSLKLVSLASAWLSALTGIRAGAHSAVHKRTLEMGLIDGHGYISFSISENRILIAIFRKFLLFWTPFLVAKSEVQQSWIMRMIKLRINYFYLFFFGNWHLPKFCL